MFIRRFITILLLFCCEFIFVRADNDTISEDDINTELSKLNLNNEELEVLRSIIKQTDDNPENQEENADTAENIHAERTGESHDQPEAGINYDDTAEMESRMYKADAEPNEDYERVHENNENGSKELDLDKHLDDNVPGASPDVMLDFKARTGLNNAEVKDDHVDAFETMIPVHMLPNIRRTFVGPSTEPVYNPYNNLFNKNIQSTNTLSREISLRPEHNLALDSNTYPYTPLNFEGYVRPLINRDNHPEPMAYNPYFFNRRMASFPYTPYRVT